MEKTMDKAIITGQYDNNGQYGGNNNGSLFN